MPEIRITLPDGLTTEHLSTVLAYFENSGRLSSIEWKLALKAFDLLGRAMIVGQGERQSFRQFYDQAVDRPYADQFLVQITAPEATGVTTNAQQQKLAFEIIANLERDGWYAEGIENSEYLAAYCLYWWTSFARGYRFELEIFRDLRAAGVDFTAHDVCSRSERRSPYDLVVQRRLGDIKHTTYFLYTARSLPLTCDFYITRLYDSLWKRYRRVVILTESAWYDLDGVVADALLTEAADRFPDPVGIIFEGQRLIVVTFDLWLEKIRQRQQEEI
ncbi:MAG: hypothetical protein M3X11_06640 [Acidobacteriota bacterium]|nr:hypothetical protein [Acidobacteriota bacterium]